MKQFSRTLAEFAGLLAIMGLLGAVLIVAGCAPTRMVSAEEQRQRLECDLEAAKVTHIGMVTEIIAQARVRLMCLRLRGLE